MPSERYLTIEEVSIRLHIGVGTARNRLSRGDAMPPSVKVGRRRLFPESRLDEWLTHRVVSNDEADFQVKL